MANVTGMTLTLAETRATREGQVFEQRSDVAPSAEVLECEKLLAEDPTNPELWLKKGLALSKQVLHREAVEAFSIGLSYDPFNWALLRYRGHRCLSTYRFAEAAADLELATRLNPNSWDSWYHLGLAYYILGDYERAERAYASCQSITNFSDINSWAIINWHWHSLMQLGRAKEANQLFSLLDYDLEGGDNEGYKQIVLFYQGKRSIDGLFEFENEEFWDLEFATRAYGVAMHYKYNNQREEALDLLKKILSHDKFWSAFGYLAAHEDIEKGRI